MSTDDVWAGSDAGEPEEHAGQGFHPNQAYSFDVVFRSGLAFLQEVPSYALAGGAALAFISLLPTGFSVASNALQVYAERSGTPELNLVAVGLNFVQIFASVAGIPFVFLFRAGLGTLALRHIRGESVEYADLYRNVAPAVRLGLYSLLVGLIASFANLVILVPLTVAVIAAAYAAAGDIPTTVTYAAIGFLGIVLPAMVALGVTATVFSLGGQAAAVVEEWPPGAVKVAFDIGRNAPVTLLITSVMIVVANVLSFLSLGCLVGVVLIPACSAVCDAGLIAAYLLYSRPQSETSSWEFFKRNPPSIF